MVDVDLIAKKLAYIETLVAQLRTMAEPDRIASDVIHERFVAHTLQLAIQAALDVASHVVSDRRLGEPRTNRELFEMLGAAGWVATGQIDALRAMAGFRNVVVHGYDHVDLSVMRDILLYRLADLDDYVVAIRRGLAGPD